MKPTLKKQTATLGDKTKSCLKKQRDWKASRIRLLLTLAGLAVGFVLSSFALQISIPDPQLREQIVALPGKFTEAWNNNDAASLAGRCGRSNSDE